MKPFKPFALFTFVRVLFSCGPTIYKAGSLDESKAVIKTIAILPLQVTFDNKRLPKGIKPETLKESQINTGYSIQSNAYSWLLKRKKRYTTEFQDIDKTNSIIKKAYLTYDDIVMHDKGDLCKLLGVDAVISGNAVMSKPMSEGAAVAVGLLIGYWGSTNSTDITLNLHDTKSDLLWKYDYSANGTVGSSTPGLTKALMRNASKKFPFKVEKSK
jgi:hypothetical protein